MQQGITYTVLYVVFLGVAPVFGLFGLVANIINIIVYIKLGFNESINVSLLALAISDLFSLILVVPIVGFFNPAILLSDDLAWDVWEVFYIVLAFPNAVFFRITCFITVFITLERCLCFLIPLKVRILITPGRSTAVVIAIYLLMLVTLVPAYMAVKLGEVTYPSNVTVLRLVYATDRETSVQLLMLMFSANCGFQVFALICLISVNVALAFAIKRQIKWRESTIANVPQQKDNGNGKQLSVVSQRSRRLGRMIQNLSLILLASYIPSSILFTVGLTEHDFYINRKYHNEFFTFWSLAMMGQTINSSINIFFYYRMNTRYKSMFDKLFGLEDKKEEDKKAVSQVSKAHESVNR